MSSTEIVTVPAPIPSKWDVIPIHGSDVASFKRCRRYWDWTSPSRNNLRRRVDIHGVNIPLWYGTGIHYCLEMYYDPMLRRDPVESWKTWYNFQWNGGIVSDYWLERTYEIDAQKLGSNEYAGEEWEDYDGPLYRIRGLKQLLPNIELVQEEFDFHYDLGIGMLNFYKDYSEKNDEFVVVAAESSYSIPLGFEAVDIREDSPNHGRKLEVHARGKRDAIIFFPEYNKYGIIDHKTAARVDEDYFKKLEKDEQCSNYLWAAIQEAKLHGYPWSGQMVDRVVYNALRKTYPQPPRVLENGLLSVDRTQGTTADLFKEAILGNEDREKWFKKNEKAQKFYVFLCEQGDSLFIQRDLVTRNVYEVNATGEHLKLIAKEMLSNPTIYPNPTGEFRCLQCAFRSPCIAADDGSDWKGMLADGYERNRER